MNGFNKTVSKLKFRSNIFFSYYLFFFFVFVLFKTKPASPKDHLRITLRAVSPKNYLSLRALSRSSSSLRPAIEDGH
jgi:hypothetical protein